MGRTFRVQHYIRACVARFELKISFRPWAELHPRVRGSIAFGFKSDINVAITSARAWRDLIQIRRQRRFYEKLKRAVKCPFKYAINCVYAYDLFKSAVNGTFAKSPVDGLFKFKWRNVAPFVTDKT